MAKKRKTLVNDFQDILERGNLDELKAVFSKCELNATDGKYGSTAFGFTHLPREFAF